MSKMQKEQDQSWMETAKDNFTYSTNEALHDLFPNFFSVKEGIKQISRPTKFDNPTKGLIGEYASESKKILQSTIKSIKSGNIYDPNKTAMAAMGMGDEESDMMDEMNNLDFSDFDDLLGEGKVVSEGNSSNSGDKFFSDDTEEQASEKIKNTQVRNIYNKTNKNYIVNINLDKLNQSLDNNFSGLLNLHALGYKSQTTALVRQTDLQTAFFQDTSDKLSLIAQSVKTLEDELVVKTKLSMTNNIDLNSVLMGNASISDYMKVLSNQLKDTIGMDGEIGQMLKMASADPVGTLLNMSTSKIVESLDDKLLGGRLSKLNDQLGELKLRAFSGITNNFFDLFDDITENTPFLKNLNLKDSLYYKYFKEKFNLNDIKGIDPRARNLNRQAKANFDMETRTTINKVIPGYLAKILSALTGDEEIYHDFRSGQWKRGSDIINDTYKNRRSVFNTQSTIHETALRRLKKNNTFSEDMSSEDIKKAYQNIMYKMIMEGMNSTDEIDDKFLDDPDINQEVLNSIINLEKNNPNTFYSALNHLKLSIKSSNTALVNSIDSSSMNVFSNNKLKNKDVGVANKSEEAELGGASLTDRLLHSIDQKLSGLSKIVAMLEGSNLFSSYDPTKVQAKKTNNTKSGSDNKNSATVVPTPDANNSPTTSSNTEAVKASNPHTDTNQKKPVKEIKQGMDPNVVKKNKDQQSEPFDSTASTSFVQQEQPEEEEGMSLFDVIDAFDDLQDVKDVVKDLKAGKIGSVLKSSKLGKILGEGGSIGKLLKGVKGASVGKILTTVGKGVGKGGLGIIGLLGGDALKLVKGLGGKESLFALSKVKSLGRSILGFGRKGIRGVKGGILGTAKLGERGIKGLFGTAKNINKHGLANFLQTKGIANINSLPRKAIDMLSIGKTFRMARSAGERVIGGSKVAGKILMGATKVANGAGTLANKALGGITGGFTGKIAGKFLGKEGGKALGKTVGKNIPLVGSLISGGFAISDLMKGDFGNTILDVAGMVPGLSIPITILQSLGLGNLLTKVGGGIFNLAKKGIGKIGGLLEKGITYTFKHPLKTMFNLTPVGMIMNTSKFIFNSIKKRLGNKNLRGLSKNEYPAVVNTPFGPATMPTESEKRKYEKEAKKLRINLKKLSKVAGGSSDSSSSSSSSSASSSSSSSSSSGSSGTGGSKGASGGSGSSSSVGGDSESSASNSKAEKMVQWALKQVGKGYGRVNASPDQPNQSSYDCSELVYFAMKEAGFSVPKDAVWTTNTMYADYTGPKQYLKVIDPSNAGRGDIIMFTTGGGIPGHTGILTSPTEMVNAENPSSGVKKNQIKWFEGTKTYVRPVDSNGEASKTSDSSSSNNGSDTSGGGVDDDEQTSKAYTKFTKEDADKFEEEFRKKIEARYGKEIMTNAQVNGTEAKLIGGNAQGDVSPSGSTSIGSSSTSSSGSGTGSSSSSSTGATTNNNQTIKTVIGQNGKDAVPSETISTEELNTVNKILDSTNNIYAVISKIFNELKDIGTDDDPNMQNLQSILDLIKNNNTLTSNESDIIRNIYDKLPKGDDFRIDPMISDAVLQGW